jgi:hypothetical protein
MIEKTEDNAITIIVTLSVYKFKPQQQIDYPKYLEATSKSKATQSDIDELADQVNSSWWEANKTRFNKQKNIITTDDLFELRRKRLNS